MNHLIRCLVVSILANMAIAKPYSPLEHGFRTVERRDSSGNLLYEEIAYGPDCLENVTNRLPLSPPPLSKEYALTFIPYPDTNAGANPICISYNPANNLFYAGGYGHRVVVIDPNTFRPVEGIDVGPNSVGGAIFFPQLRVILANPNNGKIYVANRLDATVSVIDGYSHQVTTTVPVGEHPVYLEANLDGNKIYVVNYTLTNGSISIVDSDADTVITSVHLTYYPRSALWVPQLNKVYIAGGGSPGTVTVLDATTNAILRETEVGNSPVGMAYNSTDQKTYVTNYDAQTVSVIDALLDSTIRTIGVGDDPLGIAYNPADNKIYAANAASNSVTIISGSNDSIVATPAVGDRPNSLLYTPSTNLIYVTNLNPWDKSVTVIDGTSNSVVDTLPTGGADPIVLSYNSSQDQIVVGNVFGGNIRAFDGSNNQILATTQIGGETKWLRYNPANHLIYVGTDASSETNLAMVVDPATNTIVATMPVSYYIGGMCINPNDNKLYTSSPTDSVDIFDLTTHTKILAVYTGAWASDIVYNPRNNYIYVSHTSDQKVTVLDGTANSVVTDILLPHYCSDLCVNTLDNKIYVDLYAADQVAVIDGFTHTVLAYIPAGDQPGRMVFNPTWNKVYAANYSSDDVTIMDGQGDSLIAHVPVGSTPVALDYNLASDDIYVANGLERTVSVIDGLANALETTVYLGAWYPLATVAVPYVNRVFALIIDADDQMAIGVIDGSVNALIDLVSLGLFKPTILFIVPYDLVWDPLNYKVFAPTIWHSSIVSFPEPTLIQERDSHRAPSVGQHLALSFHPNPCGAAGRLSVSAPRSYKRITLGLYDVTGRQIAQLRSGKLEKGLNAFNLTFSHPEIGRGIYYLAISEGTTILASKKIICLQ